MESLLHTWPCPSRSETHLRHFPGSQWLRHHASTAGPRGSIPSWGTKILHAAQCGQKTGKKKRQAMAQSFRGLSESQRQGFCSRYPNLLYNVVCGLPTYHGYFLSSPHSSLTAGYTAGQSTTPCSPITVVCFQSRL